MTPNIKDATVASIIMALAFWLLSLYFVKNLTGLFFAVIIAIGIYILVLRLLGKEKFLEEIKIIFSKKLARSRIF